MTSAIRRIGKVAKPKPATKAELRREIAELRKVGRQMSNVCFSLGQHLKWPTSDGRVLTDEELDLMRALQRQWDAIKRAEPK